MKYVNGWQKKPSGSMSWGKLFGTVLAGTVFVAILTTVLFAFAVWQSYRFWLQSPNDDAVPVAFTVEEGDTLATVAEHLVEQDVIASAFWFRVYSALDGSSREIQAGQFELTPGLSYAETIDILTDAESNEVQITIPEGFTLEQIANRVTTMSTWEIDRVSWETAVSVNSPFKNHPFVVSAQKPQDIDLEGYLFPETYRFYTNATANDVVERLLNEMQDRIEEEGIVVPEGWTMHEVLTLASIIEREVPNPEDMSMIADIFLKRLEIGMALQSDATINYLTGKDDPTPSAEDLEIDSMYNTYRYPGLPPGPIANPGIEAIKAVVNPTSNHYYYYLTTSEGEVIYSVTHDEHVANKAKYLY